MAFGDFDGIHLGHQEVIQRHISAAETWHASSLYYDLSSTSAGCFGSIEIYKILTPLDDKMELFAAWDLMMFICSL